MKEPDPDPSVTAPAADAEANNEEVARGSGSSTVHNHSHAQQNWSMFSIAFSAGIVLHWMEDADACIMRSGESNDLVEVGGTVIVNPNYDESEKKAKGIFSIFERSVTQQSTVIV
jgi:hypothetical protein